MRKLNTDKLGTKEDIEETSNVMNLQGIGREQAERFSEEGIENVLQLAYCDPVDIAIRTGYSFSYVVDCCSQALAWLCFEKSMDTLRKYGIRGAQEIVTFVYEISRLANDEKEIQDEELAWAEKTLDVMASDLNMDKIALRRTFDEIAYDPYSQMLNDIWQSDWNLKS
jgi:hypothetical protein